MGYRLTPIVRNLLLINLAIFLLDGVTHESLNSLMGLRNIGANNYAPWQYITYMFLHADFMHLFSNMLLLFFIGPWLEQVLGSRRFLVFYMICGVGAGIINNGVNYLEDTMQKQAIEVYKQDPNPDAFVNYLNDYETQVYYEQPEQFNNFTENFNARESVRFIESFYYQRLNARMSVTVGASGAIFGILIAFALIFPNLELMLLFFPVPIKAKYLVAFMVLFELYSGINYSAVSNVAHYAHLSGALLGFLMIYIWGIKRLY